MRPSLAPLPASTDPAAPTRCLVTGGSGLLGDRLQPFELGAELTAGIRSVAAACHMPGHSCYLVSSGGGPAVPRHRPPRAKDGAFTYEPLPWQLF